MQAGDRHRCCDDDQQALHCCVAVTVCGIALRPVQCLGCTHLLLPYLHLPWEEVPCARVLVCDHWWAVGVAYRPGWCCSRQTVSGAGLGRREHACVAVKA